MTIFFVPGCPACNANSEESTLASVEVHNRLHELLALNLKETTLPDVLPLLNRLERRLDLACQCLEDASGADEAEFLLSEAFEDLETLFVALGFSR